MNSSTENGTKFRLVELVEMVWLHKRFVILMVIFSVLLSVVYSLMVTPQYRSEALLRSARQLSAGNSSLSVSGLLSGSLAPIEALAGLQPSVNEAVAIIESRSFVEDLLLKEGIIYHIYDEYWDSESSQWRTGKPGIMGTINSWYRSAVDTLSAGTPKHSGSVKEGYSGPSLEEAIKEFELLRKVTVDRRTGFVRISVDWKDPALARDWVEKIVSRLNLRTRSRARMEAQAALNFLGDRIAAEQNMALRAAMSGLFQKQLEKVMLTEIGEDYSLIYIDTPFVPEQRVSPRRKLIVIGTFLLSLVLAISIIFFRHALSYHIAESRSRAR